MGALLNRCYGDDCYFKIRDATVHPIYEKKLYSITISNTFHHNGRYIYVNSQNYKCKDFIKRYAQKYPMDLILGANPAIYLAYGIIKIDNKSKTTFILNIPEDEFLGKVSKMFGPSITS